MNKLLFFKIIINFSNNKTLNQLNIVLYHYQNKL